VNENSDLRNKNTATSQRTQGKQESGMAKGEKAADQPGGVAEQAMEQARRAADSYCDFVKQAIAATPSGGNEFAERIKGYAEKNITMTQEYLRQLSQARNFQDMVRIQADFTSR
jgi:Phasin protein